METVETTIPDVKLLRPKVFGDNRGFFMESYNHKTFFEATGFDGHFVQDNHSRSAKNVLRGLHYQIQKPQGKLVRVIAGEVYDVAVDLRKSSPSFGHWTGIYLTAENHEQLWIPAGFAHGFMVLSETADFIYKTTDFYSPDSERCIAWNDPALNIDWPIENEPNLSEKDRNGISFELAEVYP
jgi:dTDP-4-dehydrorhamnose 3,5-epimerase